MKHALVGEHLVVDPASGAHVGAKSFASSLVQGGEWVLRKKRASLDTKPEQSTSKTTRWLIVKMVGRRSAKTTQELKKRRKRSGEQQISENEGEKLQDNPDFPG